MTRLLVALMLAGMSVVPAQAQTKVSQVIFISGNVADVWTTCDAFGRGIKEGNPAQGGSHATCQRIAIQSTVLNGGLLALFAYRVHADPTAKPLASWLLTACGVIHWALAIHNYANDRHGTASASMTIQWGR